MNNQDAITSRPAQALVVLPPSSGTSAPPLSLSSGHQSASPSVMDQLLAVMGRLEMGMQDVANAVRLQGPQPRPDPAPPFGKPDAAPPNAGTSFGLPQKPQTSTAPLGFGAPQSVRRPLDLPPPTSLPEITVPVQTHLLSNQPATATRSSAGNPTYGDPLSWASLQPGTYGPSHQQPPPWELSQSVPQSSSWDHPSTRQQYGPAPTDPARFIKMKPPRFNGTDAPTWIARVQYYFDHLQLQDDHRLHYVVMLFDPPAAEWVFNYRAANIYARWCDFLEDVRRRFDPLCFQDFTGLLAKLTQTGSLVDYNAKFEAMLSRVRDMPEQTRRSIYVEGLQQPVKTQVRHQHPTSVAAAMALAVEFDGALEKSSSGFQRRSWQQRDSRPGPVTAAPNDKHADSAAKPAAQKNSPYSGLPVIRLSAAEKAERIRKGLCFYCPEKYTQSHVCNKTFLAYMGADEEIVDRLDTPQLQDEDTELITADISHIYALDGRHRSDAIELQGSIGASPVRILVDTGSTHDFLHPRIAEKLALLLHPIKPFRVYVGNGESLICSHASLKTRLVIQNHVFFIDLHILPVHGTDVILGMAWQKSLRRVTSDYVDGTLEFMKDGLPICLRLEPPSPTQVSVRTFAALLSMQGDGELFEVLAVPSQASTRADSTELPASLPDTIREVLQLHMPVFGLPTGMPPPRFCDHKIHLLPNTKPINVRPYRYPYFQKTEIERQVKEMLEAGIIRPSQSSFSSPVLLIRKKDGTFRFCIDYRALNAATVPDHFPIPTSDELFDELGKARFFTKLDLRSGYHQIRMHTADVYKTAFRTHDGHFEFLVMPFGLTNAPSTFQSAMNAIFRPLLRKFVIVFFDDILVYSPCLESHAQHLAQVLSILETQQFFIKLSKCSFCSTTVDYLGHFISEGMLKADPSKIDAMVAWPVPSTVKQLRGFLGLTGYYRRFIARYAMIAAPLTELLKKDSFGWSPEAQASFEALKGAMTSAPVLRLPDFSKTFYLETDASDCGVGAVLMQDGHPLAFFSKKLGPRRRVTSTYHKELYAIVEAVQKWRQYLLGREFVIRSDQKSLKELLLQVIQTPDQQLYARKLMGYKFRIEYKTGSSNKVADALSRRDSEETPNGSAKLLPLFDISPSMEEADAYLLSTVSHPMPDIMELIRSETRSDGELVSLREDIEAGRADKRLSFVDGLIYFQRRVLVGSSSTVQTALLYEHHCTPSAGHPGVDRTFKRLAASFYWKGMRKEVKSFVDACFECQTTKYSTQKQAGLLQPLPIPMQVWEDVSMDFITGLPQSKGFTVIMVVVDRLSKYAHFAPLPTGFNALRVANLFIDTVVKHHGFPKTLVSDRDSVFLNDVWEHMLRLSGTKLNFTTAYHPQSDGQTEVRNRGLEQYLRAFTADRPNKWSNFLPWAELALNCFHHEGIGTSPFAALYGRQPPPLIAAAPTTSTPPEVALSIKQRGEVLAHLRSNLEKAQQRMRESANKHRRHVEFVVGERVLLKLQLYRQYSVARPLSTKLSRRYYGPFEILERIGPVAYRLQLPEGSRIHNVFHVSLLRPFVEETQFVETALPPTFARGRPVATPKQLADRRMVLRDGAPVEEGLLQWMDDDGEHPTWEPMEVIQRRFPHLLADKELSKGGGVDTGPIRVTEIELTGEEEKEEEQSFATNDDQDTESRPSSRTARPVRSRKKPVKLADYI